jgi:hypothetical protein
MEDGQARRRVDHGLEGKDNAALVERRDDLVGHRAFSRRVSSRSILGR